MKIEKLVSKATRKKLIECVPLRTNRHFEAVHKGRQALKCNDCDVSFLRGNILICTRAVAKSENPGGHVVLGGDNVPPLVEIGLADLPKSGGARAPTCDGPDR